jgi:O-antigen/teichoic acid export membrane protein
MFKFNKNLSSLFLLQWAQYGFALALIPYLLRTLGENNYGLLVVAQSWSALFFVIVEYGFSIFAISEIAKIKEDKGGLNQLFWEVTFLKFLIFLILFLILGTLYFLDVYPSAVGLFLIIALSGGLGVAFDSQWLYLGLQKSNEAIKWVLPIRLTILAGNFLFVKDEADALFAIILYALSYMIPGVAIFIRAVYSGVVGFPVVSRSSCIKLFLDGSPFLLGRFSSLGMPQFTILFSSLIYQASSVALIAVMVKIVQVGTMVYAPIQQHLLAKMSSSFSLFIVKKYLYICIFLSLIEVFLLNSLGPFISNFLIGNLNVKFIELLEIGVLVIPLASVYMLVGAPLMLPNKGALEFNKSVYLAFLSHILLLIICYSIDGLSLFWFVVMMFPLSKLLALIIRIFYLFLLKGKLNESQ